MRKETFFNERRPSRWLALGLVTGFFLSMAMPQVRAASATLSTAPLFDSNWSVISVTASNEVCAANGQANGCAAVPGCVPVFTKNASTGIASWNTCTIYTPDGPGEQSWAQDVLNKEQVIFWNKSAAVQNNSFCADWNAATPTQQSNALSAIGATGLVPPCH